MWCHKLSIKKKQIFPVHNNQAMSVKRTGSVKTKKKTKSSDVKRSYLILQSASLDTNKTLKKQGKTLRSTGTGRHVATSIASKAVKKRHRPTRIYLYRNSRIMTFSVKYVTKEGKVKPVTKTIRQVSIKRRSSSKKSTKTEQKKKKKKKRACTCAVKGSCKKHNASSSFRTTSSTRTPAFSMSGNKLKVSLNGKKTLDSKREVAKPIKSLGSSGSRRKSK